MLAVLLAVTATTQAQDGAALQPQGLGWAGIYALRSLDPNLTGSDVRIGVISRSFTYQGDEPQYDYRPNVNHGCLRNAALRFYDDGLPASVSSHETAICSILFGNDLAGTAANINPFAYQGVVPAAEGHIYEMRHFVTQHVIAQSRPDVDLVTASLGVPIEQWWTRGLESMAEHEGLAIIASIGNGSNASDPPLYPGAGSNVIGVGVVSSVSAEDLATSLAHFALAYPEQSSRGPTDDGRCKPDLIAPGNCLVAGAEGDQGYVTSGTWSSFATPVVAGVAGLLIQAARQDEGLTAIVSPEGGNCLLKAILMNSATKLPYWHKGRLATEDDHEEPLDYAQGAGMVNAVRAYELLTAGRSNPGNAAPAGWDLNQLEGNPTARQVYRITVDEPAARVLSATLTWNRHYAATYPFNRIAENDNDLRLEVWAVDPQNADNAVLVDYSDSRADNVEHIHVATVPGYTIYEIVVSYSGSESRPPVLAGERFGVAWSVEDKPAEERDIQWLDLNADGVVSDQDLAILTTNLIAGQRSPEAYLLGDINMDGRIDVDDVKTLSARLNLKADWYAGTAAN